MYKKGANLEANPDGDPYLVPGAGYSANNGDIYLVFLGNYCKVRNLEGAVPKRGKYQALLGMGNGTMSL